MKVFATSLLLLVASVPTVLSVFIPLHFELEKERIVLEMCMFRYEENNTCQGSCVLSEALDHIAHNQNAKEGTRSSLTLELIFASLYTLDAKPTLQVPFSDHWTSFGHCQAPIPDAPPQKMMQPPQLG